VTFYTFPKDHWKHLRTTNVVESPFAVVRLRTAAAKRFKKVENATAVIWKTLLVAGAGSSADSVVAARDQMERVGVSLLGVAFVERPLEKGPDGGADLLPDPQADVQATDFMDLADKLGCARSMQ